MKLVIPKGTTSKRIAVFIQDSSSTTGAGLAALAFNSAGLTWYYWREDEGDANATAVTPATATRGTFTSGGFKEKDATNMPGFYELGVPNAAIATGAEWVTMRLGGATNMAPLTIEIQLSDPVRGLGAPTALPNAAAEAAGGLYTRGSGAGQIAQDANGRANVNVRAWLDTAVSTPTVAGVPNVNAKTWNDLTTVALPLIPTTAGRTLDVSAGGEAGVDWANVGSPTTTVGLSGTTVKTATDVETDTQDIQSKIGTPAGVSVSADIAAIEAQTDDIGTAGAGLTAVPWNAAWDAEVQSEVDDALVAQRLDELLNADSDIDGAAPPTVGSVFHEVLSKTAGSFTFDQTTDSLEAVRDATLDAAGVRTAIGLASANLDTQLDAVPTANENADALLDRATAVDSYTFRQSMRLMMAALAGKSSGGAATGASSPVFRAADDSKNRITATCDASGNRSAVTLDAT